MVSASFLTWISNAFDYEYPFSSGVSGRWLFAWIDLELFNLLLPIVPLLLVVALYSWVWLPLGRRLLARFRRLKSVFKNLFGESLRLPNRKISLKILVLCLFLSSLVAILVTSYSYVHLPDSALVGSDSAIYRDWLVEMEQQGPSVALQKDRPLTFLFLHAVRLVSGLSAEGVVRVMPVVCAVGLCLGVFWFVRVGTKNDPVALLAALFTAVSFQTTVGVHAYSVANWLALIGLFVLFGLLLKGFESRRWIFALCGSILGIVLLFTHVWSWVVVMTISASYLGVSGFQFVRKKADERNAIKQLLLVLATNLIAYAIYALLPFGVGIGSAGTGALGFAGQSLSPLAPVNVYVGLDNAVRLWVGGLYGNAPLLILSILGLFLVKSQLARFNRLLFVWVAAASLPLFVFSPESYLFYRMLYMVPFQVFAAAGLFWGLNKFDRFQSLQENKPLMVTLKVLITSLVLLFLLNYALRSVDAAPLHLT